MLIMVMNAKEKSQKGDCVCVCVDRVAREDLFEESELRTRR